MDYIIETENLTKRYGTAVSYTHLDVYKRQVRTLATEQYEMRFPPRIELDELEDDFEEDFDFYMDEEDVYKRQAWWRCMTWTARGGPATWPSERAALSAKATRTRLSMCTAMSLRGRLTPCLLYTSRCV